MSRLTFPSDNDQGNKQSFIMWPVDYSVNYKYNLANKIKNSVTEDAIILPTPSGGLTLSESGQWEELEGFASLSKGLKTTMINKGLEQIGVLGQHAIKGSFVNDYASLQYKGSEFRTYSFSWDLVPSSKEEALTITEIIKRIRENSLPDYGDGSVNQIKYPSMWKVHPVFSNEIRFYLKDCVISNFTVNYTPEGFLRIYNSGHATSLNLDIEFKELQRPTRGDV